MGELDRRDLIKTSIGAGFLFSRLGRFLSVLAPNEAHAESIDETISTYGVLRLVPEEYQNGVRHALETAGNNRGELEKAIMHFKDEPSKLEAMCFLVQETPNRITQQFQKDDWNVNPIETIDAKVISADYLIENVDLAFRAVEELPWAAEIYQTQKEKFFRQILPYRIGTGTLDQLGGLPNNWRAFFWNEKVYSQIKERLRLKTSFEEIHAKIQSLAERYRNAQSAKEKREIIKEVIAFFDIDILYNNEGVRYFKRGPQELDMYTFLSLAKKEEEIIRGGRCTDLDNMLRRALMAFGIPVTSTRFIAWPKQNDNHEILTFEIFGERFDLSAVQAKKREDGYPQYFPPATAKAYREQWGDWTRASGITRSLQPGESLPLYISFYLGTRSVHDVTSEYAQTVDLTFSGLRRSTILCLGVLNNSSDTDIPGKDTSSLKIATVAAERTDFNGQVTFEHVGADDILYFPYYFREDNIEFAGKPFILHKDRKQEVLNREGLYKYNHSISYGHKPGQSTKPDNDYILMTFIDGVWKEKQKLKTDAEGKMQLCKIQPNVLYAVKDIQAGSETNGDFLRPFVYRVESGIATY